MNNKNMYKGTKNKNDISVKTIKQILASAIIFMLVTVISYINPDFKDTVRYYTRNNTNFQTVSKILYEKIEQCFKEYNETIDVK